MWGTCGTDVERNRSSSGTIVEQGLQGCEVGCCWADCFHGVSVGQEFGVVKGICLNQDSQDWSGAGDSWGAPTPFGALLRGGRGLDSGFRRNEGCSRVSGVGGFGDIAAPVAAPYIHRESGRNHAALCGTLRHLAACITVIVTHVMQRRIAVQWRPIATSFLRGRPSWRVWLGYSTLAIP